MPHLTRQLDYLTRERQHLDTLISTLQKTIQEQKGERKMTIEEKFTGFSYQDNQKYHQEAVEKYGQEVMRQALNAKKVTKTRLRPPLTKSFKLWHKIFKLVYLQQQPKTKSKQPSSCKPFALMDLTALLRYSVISVKVTSTTQSLRKTLTSLVLEQPSTRQMPLRLTFRQMQKK
ncbi:MerR family transcriptional regulator [Streptococcus pneumoniae]|nr:MerR family transcriptional regulator [Streptococcus pneumoniae]